MRKRYFAFALCILLALAAMGCSAQPQETVSESPAEPETTVTEPALDPPASAEPQPEEAAEPTVEEPNVAESELEEPPVEEPPAEPAEPAVPTEPVPVDTLPEGIPETLYLHGTTWMTQIRLNQDGSFSGRYDGAQPALLAVEAEEELGVSLPNGIHSLCEFTGQLGQMYKVSEVEYRMELVDLTYSHEPGEQEVGDGELLQYEEAYGLSGATELHLYLPGRETSDFNNEMSWWITVPNQMEELPATLTGWCLYNPACEFAFYAE